MEQAIVKAVVPDTSEAKITIVGVPDQPGIAAGMFRALADAGVNVDMIVQNVSLEGETDISFTCPHEQAEQAAAICEAASGEGCVVSTDVEIGRVSVVGAGMKSNPGVAAAMFETLANAGINIDMISTSAIRISCVVRSAQVDDATQALHDAFGLANQ